MNEKARELIKTLRSASSQALDLYKDGTINGDQLADIAVALTNLEKALGV